MFFLFNKYRFFCLFVLLVTSCLFKAFSAQFGLLDHFDIIFGVLIVANLFIIGNQEKYLYSFVVLILVIVVLLHVLGIYFDNQIIYGFRLFFVIGFLSVMTLLCFYYTAQDQTISITTLFGSISVYLFIGLIFSYIYLFVELLSPNSFSGFADGGEVKSMYFSFITLTTVGFGEIIPIKPIAQTLTWLESFTGQIYLAVIIGLMIGRYVAEKQIALTKDQE
ncbi:ion channel [Legionella waltersii]|uniref:Inward rectifier potassium channel Kirbac3, 1 n=1 Tax=Legionella waltersii TaxID=66969 RepID=A0A0W1ACC4_9GAMM|nr:ion channel [Legionella waltersii]KTD78755.1 Inward rectifier potassium channel Kirbac3, 1 [Legionella waltersii]SNV11303.1 Ion channel [Legionella waltersii]